MWDKIRWVAIVLLLPTALAFTACGVNFNPPWFAIPSATNPLGYLFVVDANGNIFLGANSVNTSVSAVNALTNALLIYSNPLSRFVFAINDNILQTEGNIFQESTNIPEANALVFRYGITPVAAITNTGDIFSRGYAVYAGSQAACPPDSVFCDTATGDIYKAHYYCDRTTWSCASTTSLYQDCNNSAYDSDGYNLSVAGKCTDYGLCTAGDTSCPSVTYYDTCVGSPVTVGTSTYYDTVREYTVDSTGTDCTYTDVNVFACKYYVDPNTGTGTAYINVCDNGAETTVKGGCCTSTDCPNLPYAICDTGYWVCQNHTCICETNTQTIV